MARRIITIPAEALRQAALDYVAREVGTHLTDVGLTGAVTAVVEEREDASPDRGAVPSVGRMRGEG